MSKDFEYNDVRLYVLGKLDPETSKALEEEMKTNALLRDMAADLEEVKDELMEIEEAEFTAEELQAGYNRLMQRLDPPKPDRGQVWKLRGLAVNVLLLNDPADSFSGKDVRCIPVTEETYFAREFDLIFTDIELSLVEYAAHKLLVTNVPLAALESYVGEVGEETVTAVSRMTWDKYDALPANMTRGEKLEDDDEDFEAWIELMREKIEPLYQQTLDMISESEMEEEEAGPAVYSLSPEPSAEIIELPTGYLDGVEETVPDVSYSMAAAKDSLRDFEEEAAKLSHQITIVEHDSIAVYLYKNGNVLNLRFVLAGSSNEVSGIRLKHGDDTIVELAGPVAVQKFSVDLPFGISLSKLRDGVTDFALAYSYDGTDYTERFVINEHS